MSYLRHNDITARVLTERQLRVLREIRDFRKSRLISPTYGEIGDAAEMTRFSARSIVQTLATRGLLKLEQGRYRKIVVTMKGHHAVRQRRSIAARAIAH